MQVQIIIKHRKKKIKLSCKKIHVGQVAKIKKKFDPSLGSPSLSPVVRTDLCNFLFSSKNDPCAQWHRHRSDTFLKCHSQLASIRMRLRKRSRNNQRWWVTHQSNRWSRLALRWIFKSKKLTQVAKGTLIETGKALQSFVDHQRGQSIFLLLLLPWSTAIWCTWKEDKDKIVAKASEKKHLHWIATRKSKQARV